MSEQQFVQPKRPQIVSVPNYLNMARGQGVTTVEAVEELVDNSIDAGAHNVWIRVQKNGKYLRIVVEDDGHGIPRRIKDAEGDVVDGIGYCLSLGGRGPKDASQHIGKFGAGLTNAACCQSLRTDVYTKTLDDTVTRYNTLDLERMEQTGDLHFPDPKEGEPPVAIAPEWANHRTGTVVVFEKVDNPDFKTDSALAEHLQQHVAMTYHRFIQTGRAIQVNGTKLAAYDPTFRTKGGWDTYDPADVKEGESPPDAVPLVREALIDDTIEIDNGDGKKYPVRVVLVVVDVEAVRRRKDWSNKFMRRHKLNEANQGFYVVRNQRVISGHQRLDLFTRNADYNYMRGLIEFPSELDKAFGVQVTKGRFSPKSHVLDALESLMGKDLRRIAKKTRDLIEKIEAEQEAERQVRGTSAAEEVVKEASILLKPPQTLDAGEVEAQQTVIAKKKEQITAVEADPLLSGAEKKQKIDAIKVEMQQAAVPLKVAFGELDAVFYEGETWGKQVRVVINKHHPFFPIYERATQDPKHRALLDLMLMSASHAESQYSEPEMQNTLRAFRLEWSNSLRVLLNTAKLKLFATESAPAPETLEEES